MPLFVRRPTLVTVTCVQVVEWDGDHWPAEFFPWPTPVADGSAGYVLTPGVTQINWGDWIVYDRHGRVKGIERRELFELHYYPTQPE
jgi:hypothetical protein